MPVSADNRLAVWYTIITALFRCPSTLDDITAQSPRVCLPYLHTRDFVAPLVRPHYEAHLAPLVGKVWPYYEQLDNYIIAPTTFHSQKLYEEHGAPRLRQIQSYGEQQWQAHVKPQVDKMHGKIREKYDENLAAHVNVVSQSAQPYFDLVQGSTAFLQNRIIVPAYHAAYPLAKDGLQLAQTKMTETVWPWTCSVWSSGVILFDRTLWPKFRILYGENVEPQLVRIGERLGRYRDGRRVKAVMSEAAKASIRDATPTHGPQTRQKIESDLKSWQDQFDKAAQTGIADLKDRSHEIISSQVDSQIGKTAKALLIELEETASFQQSKLRQDIHDILQTGDAGDDKISRASRAAGLAIKEKVQAVQDWEKTYQEDLLSLLAAASKSTLEVFDSVRKVGMHEIGSKWAKLEGVEFKDWSRYNEVRKSFDDWHHQVEILSNEIPGLDQAQSKGDEIVAQALSLAEQAGREISEIKQDGIRQASPQEEQVPVMGGAMAQKVKEQQPILDQEFDTPGMAEKIKDAAAGKLEKLQQVVSEAFMTPTSTQGVVESATSVASEQYSSALKAASSVLYGTQAGNWAAAVSAASNAIYRPQSTGLYEHATSRANDHYSRAMARVSELYAGSTPKPVHEQMTASIASAYSAALSAASSRYRSPLPTNPIFANIEQRYSAALEAASDQFEAAKTAIGGPDLSDISANFASLTAAASIKHAAATEAVSEALYGTTTGALASVTAIASSQLRVGLSRASAQLARLTDTSSEGQRHYYEAVGFAHEQYSVFVTSASHALYGSPTPVYKQGMTAISQAIHGPATAFAAATDAASSALAAAMASASSAAGTPVQNAIDAASSQYASALSQASAALSQATVTASSAVYGTESGWTEQAADNWQALVSKASEQVYGTPTPVHMSAYSYAAVATEAAATQYASVQALVSELVLGREPAFTDSVMSRLSSAYSAGPGAAAASASSFASQATEILVDQIGNVKDGVEEGMSRVGSKIASATDGVKDEL